MGQSNCQIVGITGILIQLSLGILSFSVLIIKRFRQKPKRPWKIWIMDTSKQIISQLLAHFINLIISLALSYGQDNSDACLWYLITNIFDNTFGVFVCVMSLKLIERLLKKKNKKKYISGNYHSKQLVINPKKEKNEQQQISKNQQKPQQQNQKNQYAVEMVIINQKQEKQLKLQESIKQPQINDTLYSNKQQEPKQQPIQKNHVEDVPQVQIVLKINYRAWLVQLAIWNAIVIVTKSMIFGIQFGLKTQFQIASNFLMGWIQAYPTLQLIVVIIIIPVIMNGLAFWVQDNFLKKKQTVDETESLLSHNITLQQNGQQKEIQEIQ